MNKIYKIVYNEVRQCYVVVSEFAKGHVKGTSDPRMALRRELAKKKCLHIRRWEPLKLLASAAFLGAVVISPLGENVFAENGSIHGVVSDDEYGNIVVSTRESDKMAHIHLNTTLTVKDIKVVKDDGTVSDPIDVGQFVTKVNFDSKTGKFSYDTGDKSGNTVGTVHDYGLSSVSYDTNSGTLTLTSTDKYGNGTNETQTVTGIASQTAVNEAKTEAAKHTTVSAGDNVTVTSDTTTNTNGATNYKVSVNANGSIANGDKGLVTGGTVYDETRVGEDGNYIKAANTAAANIKALDQQVQSNAGNISTNTTNISTLQKGWTVKDGSNNSAAIKATDTLTVKGGDNTTVSLDSASKTLTISATGSSSDENAVHYDADSSKTKITLAGTGETGKGGTTITNVKAGDISETSTDAVNGSQLYETNQNVTNVSNEAKKHSSVSAGDNVTIDSTGKNENGGTNYKVSVKTDGSVADGNTGIVTGGTVYNAITNLSKTDLSNITNDGKKVITGLGSKIASADTYRVKIEDAADATTGQHTYTISTPGLVQYDTQTTETKDESGTVTSSNMSLDKNHITLAGEGGTQIKKLKSGLDGAKDSNGGSATIETATGNTLTNAANISDVQKALTAATDKGFGLSDGTNTTTAKLGETLTVKGDDNITTAADTNGMTIKLNQNLSGITSVSGLTKLNKTDITADSNKAVSGASLYGEVRVPAAEGTSYTAISDTNTAAENLVALDKKVGTNATNISTNTTNIETLQKGWTVKDGNSNSTAIKANDELTFKAGNNTSVSLDSDNKTITISATGSGTDENAVHYDADSSKTKITLEGEGGTTLTNVKAGALSKDSTDAVNGSQLYATNQNVTNLTNLSNITNEGKKVITGLASTVSQGDNVTVKDDQDATTGQHKYTISVNPTGTVASENTGLVTGGTVYNETRVTKDGNYIKAANTAAGNLEALDTAVKSNADTAKKHSSVVAGDNVTVDSTKTNANGGTEYEVSVKGNLTGITSITNSQTTTDGKTTGGKISFNTDGTTISGGDVSVDSHKITNVADGTIGKDSKDAVNGGQLYATQQSITNLSDRAVKYDVNSDNKVDKTKITLEGEGGTTLTNVKAGALSKDSTDAVNGSQLYAVDQKAGLHTIVKSSDGSVKVTDNNANSTDKKREYDLSVDYDKVASNTDLSYKANNGEAKKVKLSTGLTFKDGTNTKATVGDNGEVTYSLADNLTGLSSVGLNGKDGKDGTTTTIIKTVGKNGDNGTDGTPGVDGKNGITRIVYDNGKDGADAEAHTVATLDDGLNFAGDSGTASAVKLNNQVTVTGGATTDLSDDNNIGVISSQDGDNGKLQLKLAKKLSGLTSVTTGKTTVDTNGITIAGEENTTTTSLTANGLRVGDKTYVNSSGLNANSQKVTNVADGTISTDSKDAVNGSQLYTTQQSITNLSERAVKYDVGSDNKVDKTKITLEGEGGTTLTNVKAGALSETSTDAVNGSQLYATNQNVTNLTNLSNITNEGKKVITSLGSKVAAGTNVSVDSKSDEMTGQTTYTVSANGNGKVASGDTGLVTGDTVYNETRVTKDGNYIKAANTAAGNLEALDTQVGTNATNITNVTTKVNAGWEAQVNGTKAKAVTPESNTLNFKNGDHISVTNDNGDIKIATDLSNLTGSETNAVLYDGTDKKTVTLGGTDATTQTKLTNVADGAIAKDSKDAVNGGQLYEVKALAGQHTTVKSSDASVKVADNTENGNHEYDLSVDYDKVASNTDLSYKANNGEAKKVKLSTGLNFKDGTNTKATVGDNGEVTYSLADNLTGLSSVGLNGKDGKDGMTTTIIKTVGKNGTNGTDGTPGVDGQDGITRIVYDNGKDGADAESHTVATLDDGLKFAGDSGTASAVKLNNQVTITGGVTETSDLSDSSNIGVVSSQDGNNGKLQLKLAKKLNGLTSVTTGKTTVDTNGITIAGSENNTAASLSANGLTIGDKTYVSSSGLNANSQKVTNVADGTISTDSKDAVNGSQLYTTQQSITNLSERAVKYDVGSDNKVDKTKITLEGEGGTTLTNVKAGALSETSTDAVNGSQLYATNQNVTNLTNLSNITNEGKKVITSLGSKVAAGTNVSVDSKSDETTGQMTYTVSANGNGKVASGDTGLVTGGTVYSETRVAKDGNYIKAANTAAGNLEALDTQVGTNATNITNVTKKVDTGWEAQVNGTKAKAVTPESNTLNFKNGNHISVTNDNGDIKIATDLSNLTGDETNAVLYDRTDKTKVTLAGKGTDKDGGTTLTNVKAGELSKGSTDAVNGSQLYATNQNVTNLTNLSNITDEGKKVITGLASTVTQGDNVTVIDDQDETTGQHKYTVSVKPTGTITSDNTGLVTGGTVYNETRVTGDKYNYISKDNTAAKNLEALDTQVGTNATNITNVTKKVDTGWEAQVNGTKAKAVTPESNTLNFKNGDHIKVTNDNGDIEIATDLNNLTGSETNAVLYDSADKKTVTLGGSGATTQTKLTNVADGTIAAGSKDAVNGGQLYAVKTLAGQHTTVKSSDASVKVTDSTENGNHEYDIKVDYDKVASSTELSYKANNGEAKTVKLSTGLTFKDGTNTKASVGDNGEVTYSLADNLTGLSSVGLNGKDGKDGTTTTIIKTVGKNGADGKAGTPGVDGKDGITRIVYDNGKDGTDAEAHTVATLDDGLKFAGDSGTASAVKLNNKVTVSGGVTESSDLSDDNNIGVVSSQDGANGKLQLKLAKKLSGLTSVTTGKTTVDTNGITIAGEENSVSASLSANGLTIGDKTYVSSNGLNANSQKVTNVTDGTIAADSKDAVNGGQLYTTQQSLTNLNDRAVKYDVGSDNKVDKTKITLEGEGGTTLTNVKAGALSETSTDAVNGSQLYATNQNVTNLTNLSNITNEGKKVITSLGSKVAAGENVSVDSKADETTGQMTYTVSANGSGKVASGDTGLVTGDTVYNETRVTGDKYNYISKENSAAKNLEALDTQIGTNATNITSVTKKVDAGWEVQVNGTKVKAVTPESNTLNFKNGNHIKVTNDNGDIKIATDLNNLTGSETNAVLYDGTDKKTVTLGGTDATTQTKLTNVADGAIAKDSKDAVNGGQLYEVKALAGQHTTVKSSDDSVKVADNTENGNHEYDLSVDYDKVASNTNLSYKANDGEAKQVKLSTGLTFKDGTNTKATVGDNGEVTYSLADDLTGLSSVGLNGKDGKDGTTTTIIKTVGKNGADGKAGTPGVDGQDGITRIVYDDGKDGTDTESHTVATLDDGLKFTDDFGTTAKVKLNNQLNVVGDINAGKAGADKVTASALSDGNIGVVATDTEYNEDGSVKTPGKLTVKLAKNLNSLESTTYTKTTKTGDTSTTNTTTIDSTGLTVAGGPSVKTTGVDAGGKVVTNVKSGMTGAADGKTIANLDADNDADKAILSQGANIGDVQNAMSQASSSLTDKGLTFAGNTGSYKASLGSTVSIKGSDKKDGHEYSSDNLTTEIDTNGNLVIKMDKAISGDSATFGEAGVAGKDGQPGTPGKDGTVTVNGSDGSAVVINGKDGISVHGKDGIDGKDGVSITGPNGKDGADGLDGKVGITGKDGKDAVSVSGKDGVGHIGLAGEKGKDGTNGITDIWTKEGTPGLNGADGETMTRIVYQDPSGTTHETATLDDGLKFTDDFGKTAKVKLNNQLIVSGDINAGKADADKVTANALSDGNIGVVATDTEYNEDGSVKTPGKLTVKLAKNLDLGSTGSVTTGNTVVNNSGVTINDTTNKTTTSLTKDGLSIKQGDSVVSNLTDNSLTVGGKTYITSSGLDANSQKITNVADGETSSDAVNKGQLDKAISGQTEALNKKTFGLKDKDGQTVTAKLDETVEVDGDDNLTVAAKDNKLALSLNKKLDLGSDGSITMGSAVYNNTGFTLTNNISFTTSNMSFGGNVLHNVGAGSENTDAVNLGQMNTAVQNAVNNIRITAGEGIQVTRNSAGNFTVAANLKSSDTVDKQVEEQPSPARQNSPLATEDTTNNNTSQNVNVNDLVHDLGDNGAIGTNTANPHRAPAAPAANDNDTPSTSTGAAVSFNAKPYNFYDDSSTKGSPARSQMLGGNICFRGDENITTAIKAEDVDGDGIADGTKIKFNLNKDIDLGSDGSVTMGNTVINNNGVSVGGNTYVSSDGLNANDQTITNVKAGRIAEGSTDAVNGGQLFVTDQAVIGLSHDVNKLGARLNRVGAGAAALAALHPLDFDPDAKWDFAAGYGNYRNANAVAVGTYYRPNEDTMFSVGGSFGGGENMVNAGVSLKIGAGNSNVSTSRVAMAKEIKSLKEEVENLRSALVDVAAGKQIDPLKTKLFPDIPENHWAYKAVAELAGNGMIEGYPDGKFGGDRMMTRYEMAMIVYNAMQRGAKVNAKLFKEFEPEMEYIRIDTVHQNKDGQPTVQRVRVNR